MFENQRMHIDESKFEYWNIVAVIGSVDGLNYRLMTAPLVQLVDADQKYIAIDLSGTSFLSLPAIKFLGTTARVLAAKGGELCIISPNERTKRHIEVFTGFKNMSCVEKEEFFKDHSSFHGKIKEV